MKLMRKLKKNLEFPQQIRKNIPNWSNCYESIASQNQKCHGNREIHAIYMTLLSHGAATNETNINKRRA